MLNNARLTIDCNIKYKNPLNNNSYFDNESLILEIKSSKNILSVKNLLANIIPLDLQRFSKYCEGINQLYNQKHLQRLAF